MRSNLLKYPPVKFEKISSIFGSGYCSMFNLGLTVALKSPQSLMEPFGFKTGTNCGRCPFTMIHWRNSTSFVKFLQFAPHFTYGRCLAFKNFGCTRFLSYRVSLGYPQVFRNPLRRIPGISISASPLSLELSQP